ncbi:MAG: selenide, water dikinase SelD, partial [Lachnospiraceae bacterium]|nr:selenide, water dikinase SelD [Lachnospiraceae bacterium]
PLGVGIICTANRVNEASKEAMEKAIKSMATLNKYAAEVLRDYDVHGCTDVTGFGFLGHLREMLDGKYSAIIHADNVPRFDEALDYADEFLLTAAGQRNRNFAEGKVKFNDVSFAIEELLFDPQTSGGLLIGIDKDKAEELLSKLKKVVPHAAIVGEVIDKKDFEVEVIK